jgi:hypothetical protein
MPREFKARVKLFPMEVSKALEILDGAREAGEVVCLYSNAYSSRFSAGFVEGATHNHVVLRALSPNGRADGWLLRPLDHIARIDWRGQYEQRLLFLAQMREARWSDFLLPVELSADLAFETMGAAQRFELPVQIDSGSDEPAEGFVSELSTDSVTLDKIARDGNFDGHTIFSLDDIEKIIVDDADLQDLALLSRHRGRGTGKWT